MQLFSSLDALRSRGVDPFTTFLGPLLRKDAVPVSAPIVLRDTETGSETWLVKHQEKGAIEASSVIDDDRVVFHNPYMLLEGTDVDVEPTMGDAVERIAGSRPVRVQPDLALARFDELATHVELHLDERLAAVDPEAALQSIPTSEVVARFARLRDRMRPAAERLISRDPDLEVLTPLLDTWAVDSRFDDLSELLTETNVDGALVTSPINIEELSARADGFVGAYYATGSSEVRLANDDPRDALRGTAAKRILVEENAMGIGLAQALRDAGYELVNGSAALAKWREHRDHQNLAAVVVVTRASRDCLDAAIAWLREEIAAGRPVTETEVKDRYLALVDEFAASLGIPGAVREFFSNCHAGQRTLHPCLAAGAPLDGNSTSLKLDAGLAIVIDGVTLATSDVASTFLGGDAAEETYRLFERIVRDTIAEQLKPGTVFESLHTHVVNRLIDESGTLDRLGFWPSQIDFRERYAMRNVGHLMGRQESFSSEFRQGDAETIRVGDYGACEIQWPYARHAIGAEDMWIVTPSGPLLLTK